jgi:hypothetical protein
MDDQQTQAEKPATNNRPRQREITTNPDGTVTVEIMHKLRAPEKGDQLVELRSVTIRDVYAHDLENMDSVEGEHTRISVLMSAVTGLDLDTVRRLTWQDWKAVKDEVDAQMGKPPGSGGA